MNTIVNANMLFMPWQLRGLELSNRLVIERPVLGAIETVQRQVNALLQRPHPARRFNA